MTAGTVVITGGILATVILLCIIAVLCYCRLQVSAAAVPCLATNPSGSHWGSSCPWSAGSWNPAFPQVLQLSPFLLPAQEDCPKASGALQHLLV